jgi:glutaryl-CoA dehydrogenase
MAKGELIGCFGLTEPHGGSDPANMKTHAKRRGRDWVLNGAKMWITNAPIADLAVVWARTDEGIRGFIVERDTKGFATRRSSASSRCAPPPPVRSSSRTSSSRGERAAGQYRRAQGAALVSDPGAVRDHLGRHRRRAGLPRAVDRLYEDPRAVRSSARGEPGDPDQARHDGARHYGRAAHVASARPAQGCRQDDATQVSLAKWNNCRMAIDIARDARDMLGGAGISASTCPYVTRSTSKA